MNPLRIIMIITIVTIIVTALLVESGRAMTMQFEGLIGNTGTFSGYVVCDEDIVGWNVRGLTPNVAYAVSEYSITVQAHESVLPESLTFNSQPGQAIELCEGQCVYAYQPVNNLLLTQPGYRLQLSYAPDWSTLLASPSRLQWDQNGKFYDSMLVVTHDQPGAQVATVPEASPWMLLACGLGMVWAVRARKALS